MNISEFSDLEKKYCKDTDMHPVCLMCQSKCKADYSPWHWMMLGTEYCEYYEPHEYWIMVQKLAESLEGN